MTLYKRESLGFLLVLSVTIFLKRFSLERVKGCRMGRFGKVSLWYVAFLINTRFRFFILE